MTLLASRYEEAFMNESLVTARAKLDEAIICVEGAQRDWATATTDLHMAELKLRKCQKDMRDAYNLLVDVLNGYAPQPKK